MGTICESKPVSFLINARLVNEVAEASPDIGLTGKVAGVTYVLCIHIAKLNEFADNLNLY